MTEKVRRRQDRVQKRRFFVYGIWITSLTLGFAVIVSLASLIVGFDVSYLIAFLPLVYATVMIAGVAWLAWTTLTPSPGND